MTGWLRKSVAVVACLVAALGVAVAFWWRVIREPSYYVNVRSEDGRVVVEWSSCGGTRALEADSMSVYPVPAGPADRGCRLAETGAALRSAPLASPWEYGSIPEGYVMGGCLPLERGRVYRARVGGRNGGDVVFRVNDKGEPEVIERSCGVPEWLRRAIQRS
jgi:hypothetical protein